MKLCDILFLTIIAACIMSLMGCVGKEPLPVITAPAVLRGWSPQEECALAQALAPYPSDSVLWTLHDDWARMRREIGVKPTKTKFNCSGTIDGPHLQS